jgi:hypothetical protein
MWKDVLLSIPFVDAALLYNLQRRLLLGVVLRSLPGGHLPSGSEA